jgi:hypothetical protein
MGKNGIIIGAIVVVIILGFLGFMVLGKSKTAQAPVVTAPQPTKGSVISSIKDALMGSASLTCDYTMDSGTKVKAFIKSGKIRSEVTGATTDESGTAIIKDKKVYFWNDKGGFMMTMPEVSVTPAAGQTDNKGQSTIDALEQYKQYCHQATVADSEFDLPKNVKFQDMSAMMKLMAPSGVKAAPSGTAPSGAMNQQQIQDMMKKYQQPSQ